MPYETFKHGPRKGEPKTLTDRVIRFLVAKGFSEVPSRNKYRVFQNGDRFLLVGSAGGVRTGKVISKSVSVTDRLHLAMKVWELEQVRAKVTVDVSDMPD